VIVVALENPRSEFWGSKIAAPVFARIAEAAAGHLDIPPDESSAIVSARLPRTGDTDHGGGA